MEERYRNLWTAVLKQAIKDARRCPKDPVISPLSWFSSDSQSVGSFLWICGILNIDPDSIRVPAIAMK